MKNLPGRKTDVADATWLAQLGAHGLVRGSFVPPEPIRHLRDLTRTRTAITRERSREAQRLEKLLEDCGIKLSSVASDILGVSGRLMLEALIAGDRDPAAQDVLSQLTDGLSWASGWQESYKPPSKSAIFQARARLASDPLAALFERVAKPIGVEQTPGVWLAGRRLVAIDGTCLDVADTTSNAEHFGRPGVNKGEQSAFAQARVLALAECGTHAVFAAEIGRYSQSEATLTEPLLDRLEPGMLLTADRGFFSYALWRKATGTGADLLWRVRTDKAGPKPTHVEDLSDGSWLAHLRRSTPAAARREEPMLVRVIDYTIDDGRENPIAYRLFSTVLDPAEVSAADLAAAYTQRWEIEVVFDELKTHQRGPRTVLTPVLPLRDPLPDGPGRDPFRTRPGPGQLCRRTADQPPDHRPPGRFSPLTGTASQSRLAALPPAPAWPAQPRPTHTSRAPGHQTQDAQVARQTLPPRSMAAAPARTELSHPRDLT